MPRTANRRREKKLQEAYDTCGCTDSVVLANSIKLDKLINRYHKLTQIGQIKR
ncbi:MAG TPA: hypothetical protein DDW50_05340 [Firmicutes bacterium]|nr:hypothetical protein [Bacillota bacterium]